MAKPLSRNQERISRRAAEYSRRGTVQWWANHRGLKIRRWIRLKDRERPGLIAALKEAFARLPGVER